MLPDRVHRESVTTVQTDAGLVAPAHLEANAPRASCRSIGCRPAKEGRGNAASPPPIDGIPVKVPPIIGMLPGMNWVATKMLKSWMKTSNIPDFESLYNTCVESGVQFYACATTLGVMNVKMEDIVDNASCLGATAFLDFASEADVALFV